MLLNVDDIKQYIYCKRIPFYTHILNSVDKPFLVNYGTKFERNIDLDSIIKIVNKNEHGRFKVSRVKIISNKLNIIGVPDLLLVSKSKIVPVEIKYSNNIQQNVIYQLLAYAILVEEKYNVSVNVVYIFYGRDNNIKFKRIEISRKEKVNVIKIIDDINKLINKAERPEPAENIKKCYYCEYRAFCDDVI
jgi:CRISPR-associated exonuclease Cas4